MRFTVIAHQKAASVDHEERKEADRLAEASHKVSVAGIITGVALVFVIIRIIYMQPNTVLSSQLYRY